ncbi:hypothetical protein ACO0K0_07735 [Undibacterium sp. SXout11W]|uniref:hypothetical protein n=1 Tax=Undibacterium sp. SXout11W TaxID=3413050 RepID=UPI003BF41285
MFKKTDPYTFLKFVPLILNGLRIGTLRTEYQVTNYENVKLQDAKSIGSQAATRQYLVHCTQTINLCNKDGLDVSPSDDLASYVNYPLLINTSITPEPSSGLDFQLLEYSPQTVNTKVQSSGSTGQSTGATTGVSSSNTVGSSMSETNSYGASINLAESPSISANYEHSSTSTSEHSATTGAESSRTRGLENSSSASMSVKDWGAYALVNPDLNSIVWTFGQEFPWDAVECRLTNGKLSQSGQTEIVIPTAMCANLYDGVSLYPPSHLSTFGINFVMKALWLISVDNGTTGGASSPHNDSINFCHNVDYISGSHMLLPEKGCDSTVQKVHVYMDQKPVRLQTSSDSSLTTALDLGLMSLDAVGKGGNSAIVGFIPRKFTVRPVPFSKTSGATLFEIFSSSNNLLVKDTTNSLTTMPKQGGFSPGETALTATLSSGLSALAMTLYFKVLDADCNYTLYLKHWITVGAGVVLNFTINGDTDHPIKKFVVSLEAEGGENNLTRINLRNLDYSTADYADYLQLGLNSIEIQIQSIDSTSECDYQIRAISIEQD